MNHNAETTDAVWRQVFIHFHDYADAEHVGATHLGPEMDESQAAGEVFSWFFIRKDPCWRLRFLPAPDPSAPDAATPLHDRLDMLREVGRIAGWVATIYEPETCAFGGPDGMDLAHRHFHTDSHNILTYLTHLDADTTTGRADRRRELSILLCSILMRAAGQDWYEQGDIWARLATMRPHPPQPSSQRLHDLEDNLHRLISVDPNPLMGERQSLAFLAEWAEAFSRTGRGLAELARTGTLTRGVRAVLAHHVLFHWNRLGLPYGTQSLLAHTAKEMILNSDRYPTTDNPMTTAV